ncbi:hypothetical protein predicted by Glimmer/Critica [Acetobacter ghanensis]|uniref:Uncharacterized protein n=1 Tax=Acetobacter ghanensis TaxID=431306 RepID=A0A0U5F210_9PROT|nr:hypothetical protein predicted by Glimmer/Critica [Acetobacter ghanensis]
MQGTIFSTQTGPFIYVLILHPNQMVFDHIMPL